MPAAPMSSRPCGGGCCEHGCCRGLDLGARGQVNLGSLRADQTGASRVSQPSVPASPTPASDAKPHEKISQVLLTFADSLTVYTGVLSRHQSEHSHSRVTPKLPGRATA